MVTRAAPLDQEAPELNLPDPYELVSIRSVPAPAGAADSGWHRYEIQQGGNRIVGHRAGGMADVTIAVEAIVLQLNERRKHRRGRVHVVMQSRPRTTDPPIQR